MLQLPALALPAFIRSFVSGSQTRDMKPAHVAAKTSSPITPLSNPPFSPRPDSGPNSLPDSLPSRTSDQADSANQRDRLTRAIEETMNGLGFLSSSFGFNSIATSDTGLTFIVLIQLGFDPELMPDVVFSDAEHMLRHRAMSVYGLMIRAVYWRRSERLALLTSSHSASAFAPLPPRARSSVHHNNRNPALGTVDQSSAFARL